METLWLFPFSGMEYGKHGWLDSWGKIRKCSVWFGCRSENCLKALIFQWILNVEWILECFIEEIFQIFKLDSGEVCLLLMGWGENDEKALFCGSSCVK